MNAKVRKRRNRLELDEVVDAREKAGQIIIEHVRQKDHDLGELLAGITPKNQPEKVDFGRPIGKEIW